MDTSDCDRSDDVAIVTGASSGIGRAVAERLAAVNATVVVADIDTDGGAETVTAIENDGGTAEFVRTDVSDAHDVSTMVEAAMDTHGSVDVLVNNAGGSFNDGNPHQVAEETWDRIVDVNLKGQFLCARETLPAMVESGGGSMVHVSSVNAKLGIGLAAYSASKNGVLALSRLIATQYGRHGVRSNAVCPGTIVTDASSEKLTTEGPVRDEWLDQYPVGRFGHPEDVAAAVEFLSSDAASFVSGTELTIDGGLTASLDQRLETMMYDIDDPVTDDAPTDNPSANEPPTDSDSDE
ncbi:MULTISPECIES: SDR family NAD(P)-dependent oxidoreductase [Halorussus]|uniref:SDR family NAD(P)-dependent oxidoreductase n=1 Tax=Halorussus TaxID=1070314 RepID=UPI0020A2333D|nr:SDR family NAD(P)-dependent oxidoreductase [Halorussus vallis]USZ78305.1 SDR family oxidoreductase [Halorussus vallis]